MSSLSAEPGSLSTEQDISLYCTWRSIPADDNSAASNTIRILRAEADNYVLGTSHALHFFVTYILYNDAFFH